MAHNVENMFSAGRVKPWHYEETKEHTKLVQEAPTSADALHLAGLDWTVEQEPVYMNDGSVIPNYKANVRSTDKSVLGIVTDRYQIVQNVEAFEFTDAIVGETENGVVRYETAGSLRDGRQIWLLAKMPTQKVLDDEVEPYMFFSNTHDGTGAIRVGLTPIRVVCNNTLNMAISSAKRSWTTKHVGDMKSKLEEAKLCMRMADTYMEGLDEEADRLANTTIYQEQIFEILDEMFPVDEEMTERKRNNIEDFKSNYMVAYMMPDILKFGESGWRAINAMSDLITHEKPKRNTSTYDENRWKKIMDGHAIFDRFVELVNAKVL